MTGKPETRKDVQTYRLLIPQLVFFLSAIVLLTVLNLSGNAVQLKRPAVLLAGSIFAVFSFKGNTSFSIASKIILLYIIEMFFNQLAARYVHLCSYSIHLSLAVLIPLAVSFIFCRFHPAQPLSFETGDLLKSWVIVFAVIALHLLFLFILLKKIYGYGYDHDFAVLANLCLYLLVFVFAWQQLGQTCLRRTVATVFAVFFIIVMIRGL